MCGVRKGSLGDCSFARNPAIPMPEPMSRTRFPLSKSNCEVYLSKSKEMAGVGDPTNGVISLP